MYKVRFRCMLHLSFSLNHLLLAPLLQLLLRRKQLLRRHYKEREHRRKARDRQRVLRSYRRCGKSRYKVRFRCTLHLSFSLIHPLLASLLQLLLQRKQRLQRQPYKEREHRRKVRGRRRVLGSYGRYGNSTYKVRFHCTLHLSLSFTQPLLATLLQLLLMKKTTTTKTALVQGEGTQKKGER